ncbi:MAG: DUF4139 domain-containing protein, partial [Bacteroidetes bacterium]|nr:DUF4139 domain-containing protein [Bacteroidota bacterium]
MKKTVILLASAFAFVYSTAQEKLEATKVNVFKNGTYYIVREGKVSAPQSALKLSVPSSPLLGTFWLTTSSDNNIEKITYKTDTLKSSRPSRSYPELLGANIGKKVTITYLADKDNLRTVSGLLQDFYKPVSTAIIKTSDKNWVLVPSGGIVEFGTEEMPKYLFTADSLVRLGVVNFTKKPDNQPLRMSYMQAGIQWVPSYCLKILTDKELQIEMNAIVENYAEDIKNADLTLTVGNPQFFFNRSLDPLAMDYLSSYNAISPIGYTRNVAYQAFDNDLMSNSIMTESPRGDFGGYNDYSEVEASGEKTNDLFMYEIGKASILKNTKVTYKVFSSKISYKDVYEVDIPDVVNYGNNRYLSIDPEKRYDVYHSLKLNNTTKYPLTTAPVFVLNEELQPLAQDRIKYTAAGGSVFVQLSKSGDVSVK